MTLADARIGKRDLHDVLAVERRTGAAIAVLARVRLKARPTHAVVDQNALPGSGTTVCVWDPQSSGTDATSWMLFRSAMSKIWMPSYPVHGAGTGAHSAPTGFPDRASSAHWSVR